MGVAAAAPVPLRASAAHRNIHKMHAINATNRRRSFKRRRLESLLICLLVAVMSQLLQNVAITESVPMSDSGFLRPYKSAEGLHWWQHHHRLIRDVSGAGMMMPPAAPQQMQVLPDGKDYKESISMEVDPQRPKGQCLLDGEYVPETTVYCKKQVGCRAIQKTGHCCPDYKCDCQKDGKTYANGYKLVDPETPCTVCYCQGGEILCSSVTCFHRDDCTPKYIPGVCCPEYDNCPVATSEASYNKTLVTTSTTLKPEMPPPAAPNNPKITIKEITKPIEIRITDDNKAIPIHQMLKPTTTTTTSTSSSSTTTTTTPASLAAPASSLSSTIYPTQEPAIIITTTAMTTSNGMESTTELNGNDLPISAGDAIMVVANKPKPLEVNSKEVNSGDNNLMANGNGGNGGNGGDILKLTASVAYPSSVPSTMLTLTPTFNGQEPQNVDVEEDSEPSLSLFSTQGLPEDPRKVNIKREYFITTEGGVEASSAAGAGSSQSYEGNGEYSSSEVIYSSPSTGNQQSLNGFQSASGEVDTDTAGSDNIYHIILTTDGPRLASTSENYLALKGSGSSTEVSPFEDSSVASSPGDTPASEPSSTELSTSTLRSVKFTTEGMAMHQHLDEDESEIPIESNPAYPSLPGDDFSIRGDNNYQLSEIEEISEEPRSIGGGARHNFDGMKSTKQLEDQNFGAENGSGSGSGSGAGPSMIVEDYMELPASSTEGSGGMDLSTKMAGYQMNSKATQIVQLMYSAEDSSEETKINNASDFAAINKAKRKDKESGQDSREELIQLMDDGSGSGSGQGEIQMKKEREPTTAKPYKLAASQDIDEVAESSGQGPADDPKDDAESLKVNDEEQTPVSNASASSKGNILSIKVQTAQQEKSLQPAEKTIDV